MRTYICYTWHGAATHGMEQLHMAWSSYTWHGAATHGMVQLHMVQLHIACVAAYTYIYIYIYIHV